MSRSISVSHISKSFKEGNRHVSVLTDISLQVKDGEFFIFVGPSGSGKSTLLRIMTHLEKQFSGTVELAPGLSRKDMSFVFQSFALLPWLTIEQNISIGLIARKVPEHERIVRVKNAMVRMGLEKFSQHFPRELSGGMRQRVGIARAMVTEPKILFLDEPFSELDTFTAEALRKDLLDLWHEKKMTVIMVSHIVEEAVELADRIAVFSARPAHIEKIIENHLPRPRAKRSPEFFKLQDEITALIKP